MYNSFIEKVKERIELSEEEETIIKSFLTTKKIRKKQYFLQAGDVCKSIAFVTKGTLRAYSTDEKGAEHIVQFAIEGWMISDLFSFMTQEPSIYHIDAIEDTEAVIISQFARAEILKLVPAYESFTRHELTGAYSAMQKRITSLISLSPAERYKSFISLYPDIVQRVPQHMIASYLGLKPETLSRVRKKL